MLSKVLLVVAVAALTVLLNLVFRFYQALRTVQKANVTYFIVPIHSFNRAIEILRPLWSRLVNRLPKSWRGHWYMLISESKLWNYNYNLFRNVGTDNFATVTFFGETEFFTADPDVISQVTGRKVDFPKPLHMYKLLDVYGRNVVTTEGHEWRRHRKIVGPPFTEGNNHLVWNESVYQARAMMDHLLDKDKHSTPSISDIERHVSYVALGVISKAGYGVRLGWKDESGQITYLEPEDRSDSLLGRDWIEGKTHGHTLSFGDALYWLAKYLLLVLLLPESVLKILPFKAANMAQEAYSNWNNYMKEMLVARRKELSSSDAEAHDLLANLVRHVGNSSGLVDKSATDEDAADAAQGLSDDEILGNAFVLMVAGHETSAGALEHILYMIAIDVGVQRKLQAEIDQIFGGKAPSEWQYQRDFPKLFEGITGAILAEVLRLIPAVMNPPKWCPKQQTLTVDGKTVTLPPKTELTLDLGAVHRNPKYWPHGPHNPNAIQYAGAYGDDDETDLCEFKPERWLTQDGNEDGRSSNGNTKQSTPEPATRSADAEALSVNMAADNAASFFRPPRGAYLPFSEGFRSCMGRRFAQVEVMAVLAVIFQNYSVELAVDRWASPEKVAKMSRGERIAVWEQAREHARQGFATGMEARITQKMRNSEVPIRFVKRGEELFDADSYY